MEPDKTSLQKHYLQERFSKIVRQKRITPLLTKFKDDIVRACQFTLDIKWENCINVQMHRREAKRKQEAEQLNWCRSPSNKEWYEDK